MPTPRSRADLEAQFAEQTDFLRTSATMFDSGREHEAKRMAVALRILLHDTRRSRSVLHQLGLKDIGFLDTARDLNPANMLSDAGLVLMTIGNGGQRWTAPLASAPRAGVLRPFNEWWHKIVFRDALSDRSERQTITRENLVLAIADQDGGAHVDSELESVYASLTRENSMGWVAYRDGREEQWPSPHGAAIRQIVYEVLESLQRRLQPAHSAPRAQRYHGTPVGRNDLCPCGSGRKFKRCCGAS